MPSRVAPSRMTLATLALSLALPACAALAQSKEKTAPPSQPAPGVIESKIEVVAPEVPPKPSEEVVALLEKLEKQSKATQSLQAIVRYDLNQLLQGDEQTRFGKLIYVAGPPAKFAVHFETLRVDKKAVPSNRWYIFDGQWLVEKLADKKQFFKWQVVAPDAPPADADPLGLGRGPFVVPVALRKDLVLKKFKVEIAAADAKGDPKNSVHLVLKPLRGQRVNFTQIDLWYDKDTLLPQRARTINASETESIIHLSDVKLNTTIEGNPMDTAEPKDTGWEVQITPWEGAGK